MWTSGTFGYDTPRKLIFTTIFFMNKMFGWRAKDEARQCHINDLERKEDENGKPFYEWNEKKTKTRQGKKAFMARPIIPRILPNDLNPERRVVRLIDTYLEKRRTNTTPALFLAINDTPTNKIPKPNQKWYKECPLGENTISSVVKILAKEA